MKYEISLLSSDSRYFWSGALKDRNGRTQVHKNGCNFLGQKGVHQCGCPLRLSYKTVDSYIGKLRAIFHAIGRTGEWDQRLDLGNPATDNSVKDYLRVVTMERLQARIQLKEATPFFIDKLDRLVSHIERSMVSSSISPTHRFILARDQAYFKAVFFSGDRPGDMGQVEVPEILFPTTMVSYLIMCGEKHCVMEIPTSLEFNVILSPNSAQFRVLNSIWPFLTSSR